MITFNKDSITITLRGCKETYIETLKALNDAVADLSEKGESTYLLNNLINDMLPDFRQIINIDEGIELDKLKLSNQKAVTTLANSDNINGV